MAEMNICIPSTVREKGLKQEGNSAINGGEGNMSNNGGDEKSSNFKFSIGNQEVVSVDSQQTTQEFSFLRSMKKNYNANKDKDAQILSGKKSQFNLKSSVTNDSSSKDPFFDFFAKSMQRLYNLGLDKCLDKSMGKNPMFGSSSSKNSNGTGLKKRKRGRPRKHPKKEKKLKKTITPFDDSDFKGKTKVQNRTTIIKTKIGDEFYSDAEDSLIEKISIKDLQKREESSKIKIKFAGDSLLQIHPTEQTKILKKEENRLFLAKLLNAIQEQENRNSVKRFMCRFCGKTFDKPSSLGGHTAKKHNGLSRKYKKRLDAAKNRKTERDRNNFIKKKLVEEMKSKTHAHSHC